MVSRKATTPLPIGPILFDLAACITLGLLLILVPELTIQPYQRGFFCNDVTIRLPYKDDTISPGVLVVILLAVAVVLIAVVEIYRNARLSRSEASLYAIKSFGINRIVVRFATYLGYCLFGLCFEYVFCEATKLAVGRLRPNFMDVCKPNVGANVCDQPYVYITNYTCTSHYSAYLKREAHVSFFSGHTATTSHVVTYCVIYIYARLPRRLYGVTLGPIVQTILVTGGLLIGYSRIIDHKHHWSDVFAGFIVGIITGTLTAVYFARLLDRRTIIDRNELRMLTVDYEDPDEVSDDNDLRSTRITQNLPSEFSSTTNAPNPSVNSDMQVQYTRGGNLNLQYRSDNNANLPYQRNNSTNAQYPTAGPPNAQYQYFNRGNQNFHANEKVHPQYTLVVSHPPPDSNYTYGSKMNAPFPVFDDDYSKTSQIVIA